jgi:hypothetical protein
MLTVATAGQVAQRPMQEYFAIKRSNAWLWSGKLTRDEVLARLEKDRLGRDWLICPLGCANRAVTLGQFVDDPAIFLRLEQQHAQRQDLRRSIAASIEKPLLLKIGQQLIGLSILCLVIGGAIVKLFFPQMRGDGLTPTDLIILIPIWSMGGIGLVLWIIGCVHHRHRVDATLQRQMEQRDIKDIGV